MVGADADRRGRIERSCHGDAGAQAAARSRTYTFATGEMDWQAGSQCNTTLRMQGSTDLFAWGSPTPRAYGNRYDVNASSASSTGTAYASYSGQWGVTITVLFFVPPGWTINPGNTCAWVDTAHTQLQCTVTTGPVDTQL